MEYHLESATSSATGVFYNVFVRGNERAIATLAIRRERPQIL
jgi:hypothetical protein